MHDDVKVTFGDFNKKYKTKLPKKVINVCITMKLRLCMQSSLTDKICRSNIHWLLKNTFVNLKHQTLQSV